MTEIAFRADNGHLRAHPEDGALTNRQAGMMALTSPSIAGLFGDGYLIAFQDDEGHLRTHGRFKIVLGWPLAVLAGMM